jgi:GNAT superfamily N-acetyltransferase
MEVSFRTATADDIGILVEFRAAFLAEFFRTETTDALLAAVRAYFTSAVPSGEFVAYLAEVDGLAIAVGGLVYKQFPPSSANLGGRVGYILNMYTRPDWRGHGAATAILRRLVDHAKTAGCGRVDLHAAPKARPIYQKAGFVAVDAEMRLDFVPGA